MASDDTKIPSYGLGKRHGQIVLLFTGLMVAYSLRVNLSVGIVAMTNGDINPDIQSFDWNEKQRSIVLSSFFWGYFLPQIPGGVLSNKLGPHQIFTVCQGINAILTMLIPLCANYGWEILTVNRILQGLSQGFMYPSIHSLLSKWTAISERGKLGTFTYSGTMLGTVVMMAISGTVSDSVMGWPGIFYISGGVCALWSVFWFLYGRNSPDEHKTISESEKSYIQALPETSIIRKGEKNKIPWKSMLTSWPAFALLITSCAHSWGFWTMFTEVPSYLNYIMKMDIKSNALISALPYLCTFFLCLIMSPIYDYVTNNKYLTKTQARKIFNSIGQWIPGLALVGLAFCDIETKTLAIVLVTVAIASKSGIYVGFLQNHIDLTPNFSPVLMGLTTGVSNIMGIIAPLLVGFIVPDFNDPIGWRNVFFIAAGFYLIGNLIFVIFAQAEIQPWNHIDSDKRINPKYQSNKTDV